MAEKGCSYSGLALQSPPPGRPPGLVFYTACPLPCPPLPSGLAWPDQCTLLPAACPSPPPAPTQDVEDAEGAVAALQARLLEALHAQSGCREQVEQIKRDAQKERAQLEQEVGCRVCGGIGNGGGEQGSVPHPLQLE